MRQGASAVGVPRRMSARNFHARTCLTTSLVCLPYQHVTIRMRSSSCRRERQSEEELVLSLVRRVGWHRRIGE